MRRPESGLARRRIAAFAVACVSGLGTTAASAAGDEPAYRYHAPITIEQPAPFVQLALPASAYGRSQLAGLQDLRIVDARGERVPFAVLAPRIPELQTVEQLRDAVLYPLPPRPAAGVVWASPIEVRVQGDRISVVRAGGTRASSRPAARPGGWLIDLGERKRDDPVPTSLRLQWSAPAEFTAAYSIEVSDDLRSWRVAGSGQLIALSAAGGTLTQPNVMLPAATGRFVRLAWADAAAAPALAGAKVVTAQQHSKALDPPTELVFASSVEPPGKAASDEQSARALHFDLGGALPLVKLDLRLERGTQVVPARVQGRSKVGEPWHDLAATVFYRLERGADVSRSPAVDLRATARYVRLVPDARAATLDAPQTQLVVHAQLANLVFASQGQLPYSLQTGSSQAKTAALPAATLVPALDDERPRFGRATLGVFAEVADVARAEQRREQLAALRPWLLWLVLLAGVGGLAFMVWRLVRSGSR